MLVFLELICRYIQVLLQFFDYGMQLRYSLFRLNLLLKTLDVHLYLLCPLSEL